MVVENGCCLGVEIFYVCHKNAVEIKGDVVFVALLRLSFIVMRKECRFCVFLLENPPTLMVVSGRISGN